MRYFVRGPDGRLYGPAEIETLRDWARADRLPSYAALIEEETLAETTAAEVLGDPQTWPPPVPGMRPCPNCGRPIPVQNSFCPHCGAGRQAAPTSGLNLPHGCVIALVVVAVIIGALALGLLALCSGAFNPH